jgi:hypothetical protein
VEVALAADTKVPPSILHFENVPLFGKHFR